MLWTFSTPLVHVDPVAVKLRIPYRFGPPHPLLSCPAGSSTAQTQSQAQAPPQTCAQAVVYRGLQRQQLVGFFSSGVTSTPLGGAVSCTQVKILGKPFRSLRTLSAHPSQLEIGVLSSRMGVAPPSS